MKNSKINWTTHTFNCWEGCTHVSPGCTHCYAKVQDDRHLRGEQSHWGPGAPRRIMSDSYLPEDRLREGRRLVREEDWKDSGPKPATGVEDRADQSGMRVGKSCLCTPESATGDLVSIVESKQAAWAVEEFANLLKTSTKFLYSQVRRNLLPAYRIGSMLRLDPKAAAYWLRSRMMGSVQTAVQHG